MDVLHFLNLQYWYCIIYSLFGGRCAYLEQLAAERAALDQGPSFFEQFIEVVAAVSGAVWNVLANIISALWEVYSVFAWGLSGILFLAILTTAALLALLRFQELSVYGTLPVAPAEEAARRTRWQELLDRALSTDPKEWREAILEADRMLGTLLEELGVRGATTPDRMRNLPEDAFLTTPQAWEAHRIRNFVSSANSDFILTQREAYRVMKLYEQVFEEHRFI